MLNLIESSRHLGGLRAVELACHRHLGKRASLLTAPVCARWVASAGLAHAWRAGLLEGLLPVSVGLPALEEITVLPEGPLGGEVARLLAGASPDPSADPDDDRTPSPESRDSPADDGWMLVDDLCHRLYPLLLAEYRCRLEGASLSADGAIVRIVGRAVADLETVQAKGSIILESRRPG